MACTICFPVYELSVIACLLTLVNLNCTRRHLLIDKYLVIATDFAHVYLLYRVYVVCVIVFVFVFLFIRICYCSIISPVYVIVLQCESNK